MSLEQAIKHFSGLEAAVARANEIGVEDGARLMLTEARDIVGHYQTEDLGPADPWAELADRTKRERVALGYSPNDPGLRSGEMRDSYGVRVHMAGPVTSASIGSDDPKALWFEEGTHRADPETFFQPPRHVLSVAAFREERKAVDGVARMVVRALEGRALPNRAPVAGEGEGEG